MRQNSVKIQQIEDEIRRAGKEYSWSTTIFAFKQRRNMKTLDLDKALVKRTVCFNNNKWYRGLSPTTKQSWLPWSKECYKSQVIWQGVMLKSKQFSRIIYIRKSKVPRIFIKDKLWSHYKFLWWKAKISYRILTHITTAISRHWLML